MDSKLLSFSEHCYRGLLWAYPSRFRRRFGEEMAQVFRTDCRSVYHQAGNGGLVRLWLPTLWDWALTTTKEHLSNLFGGNDMYDTTNLDRQLGNAVWMLRTGLLAGYSLRQVLQALAKETPEPIASAFRQLWEDMDAGLNWEDACVKLKRTTPSVYLAEVLQVIARQRQTGGNLADLLEPVGEKILQQAGSDPALYEAMRVQARTLGASVPERARA